MIDALCTTVTATPICLRGHAGQAALSGTHAEQAGIRRKMGTAAHALCSQLQVGVRCCGKRVAHNQERHVSSERLLQDRLHALAPQARQAQSAGARPQPGRRGCMRCVALAGARQRRCAACAPAPHALCPQARRACRTAPPVRRGTGTREAGPPGATARQCARSVACTRPRKPGGQD